MGIRTQGKRMSLFLLVHISSNQVTSELYRYKHGKTTSWNSLLQFGAELTEVSRFVAPSLYEREKTAGVSALVDKKLYIYNNSEVELDLTQYTNQPTDQPVNSRSNGKFTK